MDESLLEQIAQANHEFLALLDSLTDTQATRPCLLGRWSAREVLAHLLGWQEAALTVLLALEQEGAVPEYEDEGSVNEASVARHAAESWNELKDAFAKAQAALLTLARRLPPSLWDDRRVAGWLRGSTILHYPVHREDFERAAIARSSLAGSDCER